MPSGSPAAPKLSKKITVTVFKVPGETNTDDLSPAPDAASRPDIPLHYLAMLKNTRPDAAFKPEARWRARPHAVHRRPEEEGPHSWPTWRRGGHRLLRKSATNCVIWATGEDIPFVPNKRFGGVTLGGKIAPSSSTPGRFRLAAHRSRRVQDGNGRCHRRLPYEGKIEKTATKIADFQLKSQVLLDEVQAGGRIHLIIGRALTAKAREALGLPASTVFRLPQAPAETKAALPWPRRWWAAPVVCRKARACARHLTANPR